MKKFKTIIIGGGLTGLAAGYRLSKTGDDDLLLIEKESDPGGMAASYHIGDYYIEKYYHHIFKGDVEILQLIHEMGLDEKLEWLRGTTGYYIGGKIYPMNTPFQILRSPLSFSDVINIIKLIRKAKTLDVTGYDDITAKQWILENAGEQVYSSFFEPLLRSKFGSSKDIVSAAWLLSRVKIRSNRGLRGERLGYMRGGFHSLIESMSGCIKNKLNGTVSKILTKNGRVWGVVLDDQMIECDRVISTVSPVRLKAMLGEEAGPNTMNLRIRYQGTACILFGMQEKLMDDIYWLNVKGDLPFGAVIEHTNFVPLEDYNENLLYVTSYFQDANDRLWKYSDEQLVGLYMDGLEQMFPGFKEKVKWWRVARDIDTAPVYETGYGRMVLPYASTIKGLYLAGMFSPPNYPERSMNGSIRAGFECADTVMRD